MVHRVRSDMFPSPSCGDIRYRHLMDSILCRDAGLSHSVTIEVSDLTHRIFGQFRIRFVFPPQPWEVQVPLRNHISDVLFGRPGVEMIRSDARSTGTDERLMQAVEPFLDRPVREFVRKAVGAECFYSTNTKESVSTVVFTPGPKPTSVRLNDLGPESFLDGFAVSAWDTTPKCRPVFDVGRVYKELFATGLANSGNFDRLGMHSEPPIQVWGVMPRAVSAVPRLPIIWNGCT